MKQDSVTTESPTNVGGSKARNMGAFKIVAILASIVAICGIGFGIFGIVQNSNANARINELESEITSLHEQLEQKTTTDSQGNDTNSNLNANQNNPDHVVATKKYLEPQGWNIRFAYPEGVTDVQYDIQNTNWDGVLYVSGITKDGKTYNVDLFGGKNAYRHYPFFLGAVARLSAANSPSGWVVDAPLLFKGNNYSYYRAGGNGYEAGDAAEYEEACRIVEALFNNVESR